MSKLLLFDVDGVIVDSFDQIYPSVARFIEKKGGPKISEDDFRKMMEGNSLESIAALIGKELDLDHVSNLDVDEFVAAYDQTEVYEGMPELLRKLAVENTLVIVTSSFIDPVIKKFEEAGIYELFAGFMGPRVDPNKDDKIKIALKEFDFKPQKAVFISDTSGDILEAQKTGVKTIAVTWGYHSRQTLEKVEPDQIVNTPQELLKILL